MIFIDAIVVKVRDGAVTNKPFYVVIGVTTRGERDILGDLGRRRRRGREVLVERAHRDQEPWRRGRVHAVYDGLKGLPEAITTVWEFTQVQTCVIHLIRTTFRYAARQDWDAVAKDLRPISTAVSRSGSGRARLRRMTDGSRLSPALNDHRHVQQADDRRAGAR